MRVKTWKVLDYGQVPADSPTVLYTCKCGTEAALPVVGMPIAQFGMGLVFDNQCKGHLPAIIKCRKCRRIFQ